MTIRARIKGWIGAALWPYHARLAAELVLRNRRGLVLTFHNVGTPVLAGVAEDLFISDVEFGRVLDFITEHLTPLPPAVFLEGLRSGTLPARATLITFDDCCEQTVVKAFPELVRRNLTACFFVNPGLIASSRTIPSMELMGLCAAAPAGVCEVKIDRSLRIEIGGAASRVAAYRRLWPRLLNCPSPCHPALLQQIRGSLRVEAVPTTECSLAGWRLLKMLDEAGMLIGNHTMFHSTVAADGVSHFGREVAEAYRSIEEHLGVKARVFCYPYGRVEDSGPVAEEVLRGLGTDFAFVTQGGVAAPHRSGHLNLHREDASYSAEATKLAPLLACLR